MKNEMILKVLEYAYDELLNRIRTLETRNENYRKEYGENSITLACRIEQYYRKLDEVCEECQKLNRGLN